MSCSGNPPPPPSSSTDQRRQNQQTQPPPMSFRSSVGSKPSPLRPLEGSAAPTIARVDLRVKSAVVGSGGGVGSSTSGYYADVAGTFGSSWISRLRPPFPQPPPAHPSSASPPVATAGISAGTEGSGVAGGAGGGGGGDTQPLAQLPQSVPFITPAYHVQRLRLSPLGLQDELNRSTQPQPPQDPPRHLAAGDRVGGFGPFRFGDVRVRKPGTGIKWVRRVLPPDRTSPRAPPHPLPTHTQPTPSQPPPRTNPALNPAANGADARCLIPRPSGFFPLFAKMVRAGEEARGTPKTAAAALLCAAEGSDRNPPVIGQRELRASAAETDTFHRHRSVVPHHLGQSQARTRPFPLLPDSSTTTGCSTVRLASHESSSRAAFLSRQTHDGLVDLDRPSPDQSLTDAVFPTVDGRSRGLPAFLSTLTPVAAAARACIPAAHCRDSSAHLGNAEGDPQKLQLFHKDVTAGAAAVSRNLLAGRNCGTLPPACVSEDRFSFWNMGRFWPAPAPAASETLSRKRLPAPDAVLSPLKCRRLDNQC